AAAAGRGAAEAEGAGRTGPGPAARRATARTERRAVRAAAGGAAPRADRRARLRIGNRGGAGKQRRHHRGNPDLVPHTVFSCVDSDLGVAKERPRSAPKPQGSPIRPMTCRLRDRYVIELNSHRDIGFPTLSRYAM